MDHTAIARPFSDQERPFVPPTAKDGDPIRKRIQRAMFQVYTSVGRLRSDQIDVTEAFLVVFRRGWLAAATGHPGHTSEPRGPSVERLICGTWRSDSQVTLAPSTAMVHTLPV